MKCLLFSFFFFFNGMSTGYNKVSIHSKYQINNLLIDEKLPWEDISCTKDEECQSRIVQSKCIEKFCKCTNDTILSSDASKCLPLVREYGSPCEDNIQCSRLLSTGGICDSNRCQCRSGYHYLKGFCWKNINLNEKCFANEQCFSAYEYVGLQCENNLCKCRPKYRSRFNSGCRRERVTGETCNLDFDCIDHSTCENMNCRISQQMQKFEINPPSVSIRKLRNHAICSNGTFEYGNRCVLELGMECAHDSHCSHIENALCLDNSTCACKPALYVASEDNRQCLQVSRGKVEDISRSSCKTNSECGVFGGNSICQNRRCACKNGTYFEKKSKFCWTFKHLKESCVENEDCNPLETHAECVKTKQLCHCQKGYHSKGSKCILDALEVGDPCINDDDCFFPNSYCNASNTCTCTDRYYPENGTCIPGIETSCSTNADCTHLKNTECKIGHSAIKQCLCLENYTNSDDYSYCLPVVGFKQECMKSFQCRFSMEVQGVCKHNICECQEGEHYFNGKCYKSKRIGESCSRQLECLLNDNENSVICLKGFCSCNYDYKFDDSGLCVKTNSAITIKFYSVSLTFLVIFFALRV